MKVAADPLTTLRTRTSEKWRAYPDDVLPLFVAEMDYPLAAPIAESLVAAVRRSDTGYIGGDHATQEAFAQFALDRWGWSVDPAAVLTTTDVSVVVVEALRASIRPGDGVVICPPVYAPFFELVPEAGGVVVEVPLVDDGESWSLDLDGLEEAFARGARAFLLCNPHNPVGLVHSPEALRAVADLAERFGVTVVSDEIHAPLTHSGAHFTPYLAVSDAARAHGIAAQSASKAWNLAGLKCALMVAASSAMSARIHALPAEVQVRTSHFGRIASIAAFTSGGDWLDGVIRSLEANRALLTTTLAENLPGVGFRPPSASYLAWLDLRALGWGDDPADRALHTGRVAINSGLTFGRQGAGFSRLNFACSPDILVEAIERLSGADTIR